MQELSCSHCASVKVSLVEDVTRCWSGVRLDEQTKTITIDTATDRISDEGSGDEYLECRDCGFVFPIPADYTLRYA